MNVIEDQTELFDLFGESGTCVVCQEDFSDGERVRTINKCKHMFHMNCIDPWLVQKSECPLCRTPIYASPQTIYKTIRSLYTELQLNRQTNTANPALLAEVLSQMENIMISVQPIEADLQRYVITYSLIVGILRKFPKALDYNQQSATIRGIIANFQLNDVRPYPIDFDTHSSLKRSKNRMLSEIREKMPWQGTTHNLHKQHQFRLIHNQLALNTVLEPIWR